MAIDKNFVIKNGLEVNTNVLVAAADEKQVGIGTTRPYYKLHVGGGEGSRGGIGATDLTISGIATIGVAHSDSGAFRVLGISTFQGDVDLLGSAGVSTVRWDASENRLEFKDNASVGFGTGNDLTLWHDSSTSYIKDTVGDLRIAGDKITLELEDGTNVKVIDQFGVNITGVTTTNRLLVSGVSTFTSVGSNLIPDTDGSRSIGAATSEWQDLFIDGTAKIDTLTVDESATVAVDVTVGTGVTLQRHGGVSIVGITTVGGNLLAGGDILPDEDGSRDLGSSSKEFQDLFIDGTANIDTLAADTAAIGDLTDNRVVIAGSSGELEDDANFTYDGVGLNIGAGSGVTVSNTGNIAAAGIITANDKIRAGVGFTVDANTGNVAISGITTVGGVLQVNTGIRPDSDEGAYLGDASHPFSSGRIGELIFASGSNDGEIETATGNLTLDSAGGTVTVDDILSVSGNVNVSTGATITTAGNAAFAGIVTANGGVNVGTAVTIDAETGNVAVSGIMTVGGDLYVKGDITYDEVTGRNLNITGITTLAGQANFGTSGVGATVFANGNVAISGIVTANGGVYVGSAASIHANGNFGITGIATADRFIGIHTSADGGGIGIGSTTAHVGYGITYIDFKGPGVSTVYSSSVTGITTIYFQGGGSSVGAAGTWQNDGTQGISTAKSVGINTVGVAVTALMGGEKGASSGIGASMQGLYIGNGMMINDNQLNGNHYIGTAFGGIMAGPVTVNGVVTVDGNWAVV